jgi:hypothetical protein
MSSYRNFLPDYLYIAGSLSRRVIKVGKTKSPRRRQQELRRQEYGSIRDWRILYFIRVKNAGQIEDAVLFRLRQNDTEPNADDLSWGNSSEIVPCSFSVALDALAHFTSDEDRAKSWWATDWDQYCFQAM